MADVNANINIGVNSSEALAGLRKLETQINSFQRTIASSNAAAAANQAALNRALLDGINNTGLFSARQINAVDSMARFSKALDNNKLSLGEYSKYAMSQLPGMSKVFRKEFSTMEQIAASRVKAINTQYLALGKTVDGIAKAIQATPTGLAKGFSTEMAVAAQKQMIFNKLIDDGSTKLLNWGKNTQWAGRQLMVGLTLPLAAMGAAASKAFMEIDKASTSLKRVYGDLSTTTQEIDTNVQAIKDLGTEYTKYGIAVSDTIQIASRAAATGATNEKLMAATEQTLRFATLGQIDYNQALDTTIAMQTAFGLSNEDLASNIDYLNAVENQTVLTIEDMSLAIPRVATVIKGLGGNVQDLAIMMTAMKEGGVSAENAANGLKSGLASMINPTKQASEYLAKFGINLTGIVEANKGNLIGTVQEFGRELNKLSDMDRQRALEKTFGKYQYARMSALFDNMIKKSSQASRAMDLTTSSVEDLAKIADKELGKISESTTVKFQAALEKLKVTIAPIGEAFLKLATPVIDLITKVAEAFNNLPEPIKNALGIATAAIAGLGPILLMGIGLMGNLVANIIKGVQWWRKLGARIKGDASSFNYMTSAELEAQAATEALEGSTQSLTGKLQLQAGAVAALTAEYSRFAEVAGIASGAMGAFSTRRTGKGGKGKAPIKMATGGVVPGSGSGDKIPAVLEPGETVVTKKASKKYGPIINAMNAGTLQGFQGGKDSQSSREQLVFAHGQDSIELTAEQLDTLKKLSNSQYVKEATRGKSFSNFGFIAPEKFNRGEMTGKEASRLFTNKKIVDRTMYPMYEAIGRELGISAESAMKDPTIRSDVRRFAAGIAKGLYRETGNIGDAEFYRAADDALSATKMSEKSRLGIMASKKATTVGLFGENSELLRGKGQRMPLGRKLQEQVFGEMGQVSYKSQKNILKKAALAATMPFRAAFSKAIGVQSPSVHAQEMVSQYVDGIEVGAKANAKDAARAGKITGKAYEGAVESIVTPQSAEKMTKAQYKAQQSQMRRDRRNIGVMAAGGITDQIMQQRILRRLQESQDRNQRQSNRPTTQQPQTSSQMPLTDLSASERKIAAQQRLKNIKAANRRTAMRGVGRGIGRAGGIIGAASIIPFMAQNDQGKFMGMDANMLGTAMMGASMIGPAFRGLATGATALAGALGVSTAAVAAPVAALAAVGVTAWLLKKGLDNTIEAGKKYADALTTSAKEQSDIAALYGNKTFAQQRKEKTISKMTGLTSQQQAAGKEFVATEQGKAMTEQAKLALEKNASGFARNLATQLSQMVISGAINPKQAQVMAAGITDALGRSDLTAPVTAEIKQILGPNGEDVTNTPLQIQASIQANMQADESKLKADAEQAAKIASDSWTDNFLGLGALYSGEIDAAHEASIAYYNAVAENTKSMLSSMDDQEGKLKDQIKTLDDQIAKEKDKKKQIELQNQKIKLQAQLQGLVAKKESYSKERRQLGINALRGNAEAQTSALDKVQEAGITKSGAMLADRTSLGTDKSGNQIINQGGGILGQYLYQKTGKMLDTAQKAEEFTIKWLVDLQTGVIDPVALQALQTMEETKGGTTNEILKTVVDLQAKGDVETAGKIVDTVSTLAPEYATQLNIKVGNGSIKPNDIAMYADTLASLPADVPVKVVVSLLGMKQEKINQFKKDLLDLQAVGIDTGEILRTFGTYGITQASKILSTIDKQIKASKKAFKEIDKISATNTKARATKTIELVTTMTDQSGKPIDEKRAKGAVENLLKNSNLDKKTLYALPPDVSTKAIMMEIDAQSYKTIADSFTASANKLSQTDPEASKQFAEKAAAYMAVYDAFHNAAQSGIQAGGFGGSNDQGGAPPPPPSPTGGGKKQNALEDMNKGFIDQIKMYANMNANIKMLNGKRETFVKTLTKGQGIVDKLRALGLSEGIISNLASQGYDALNTAYKKYKGKAGSNAVANQNQLALQAALKSTVGEKVSSTINAQNQVAASRRLQGMGLTGNQITSLVENPEIARGIANLGKEGGMTKQELDGLIKTTKTLDETMRQAARSADPLAAAIDDVSNATAMASAAIEAQNAMLELNSDQQFAAANGMTKQQAELEIALNEKKIKQYQKLIDEKQQANDKDQHEIDLLDHSKKQWQDKIDLIQSQIDVYQKSIDAYQRENELRDQQANVINHSLDLMSKQETEINNAYDARIKALDEVASINQHILDQQQSQLDISQALSSGDIYAAAQAQQQMQAQSAQYAADQMRAGMDLARQNAVSGLTTDTGLTRVQAEQQLADLKEQNYQNDLLITGLQNQIYTTTQSMLPYKEKLAEIDKSIATYNETIWQRNQEIYDIQNNSIKPITDINAKIQERLDNSALDLQIAEANTKFLGLTQQQWDAIGRVSSGVLNVIQSQTTATQETIAAVNALADSWSNVGQTAAAAIKAGTTGSFSASINKKPDFKLQPSAIKDWASIIGTDIPTLDALMAGLGIDQNTVSSLLKGMTTQNKYKGGMIRYASGSYVVGSGGRDSIHAMLTPGEFVVRKSMVDKYGSSMFNSINQGSFEMPTYSVGSATPTKINGSANKTNISAPVYNTYSVNVPVSQPGASADEIANKVMTKLKNVENGSIRRINGYQPN